MALMYRDRGCARVASDDGINILTFELNSHIRIQFSGGKFGGGGKGW